MGFTETYLEKIESHLSRIDGTDCTLDTLYVLLEAIKNSSLDKDQYSFDITNTEERLAHAGLSSLLNAQEKPSPLPLGKVLNESKYLSLIGEPGSGKSTTLQYIGLCFAHPGWAKEKLQLPETGVPVLVKLGEIGNSLSAPGTTFLDNVIVPKIKEYFDIRAPEDKIRKTVINWIEQGSLVLLLDGLDEIKESVVKEKLKFFINDENIRKCRLILSSRPAGYSSQKISFKEYRLKPFSKDEDILCFIENWLIAIKPEWKVQYQKKTKQLFDALQKSEGMRKTTDNPLLLRLAVEGFCNDERIAQNRADLFRRYVEKVVWESRETTRVIPQENRPDFLKVIEEYAWKMQGGELISWNEENEQMAFLRKQLGLISVFSDERKSYISFNHLTFREYFVARYLARFFEEKDSRDSVWSILKPRIHDLGWQEPLKLLALTVEDEAKNDLVQQVLHAKSGYENQLHRDLQLATTLAAECGKGKIKEFIWNDLENKASKEAKRSLWDSFKYGVFVIPYLLVVLHENNMELRWNAVYALGEIGDPLAIPNLLLLLKDESKDVRRSAAELHPI